MRRLRRFETGDGCLVALQKAPIKLWLTLDISEGGLSFQYIEGAQDTRRALELDILTRDTTISIEKIPFSIVTDSEWSHPAWKRYPLRRCGVQFTSLSEEQSELLSSLLYRYRIPSLP